MKFKFKKVLTLEEYKEAANRFWYRKTWLAGCLRQRFLEKYGEQYVVDYSFVDSNGYWGQRTTLDFKARDRISHDDVEKYFCEIMTANQIAYKIHSISLA